jgi:hypothetical protein
VKELLTNNGRREFVLESLPAEQWETVFIADIDAAELSEDDYAAELMRTIQQAPKP